LSSHRVRKPRTTEGWGQAVQDGFHQHDVVKMVRVDFGVRGRMSGKGGERFMGKQPIDLL